MSIEFVGNEYDRERIVKPSRDVTFYTDRVCVRDDSKLKIYFQYEPVAINKTILEVPAIWQKFDAILTYNDDVLKQCPNARLFHFQTDTWLDKEDYLNVDTSMKVFLVSNLTGFKTMCKAHQFRHHIYIEQARFDPNLFIFFRSSAQPIIPAIGNNPIIGKELKDKIILFRQFQFSLVIENTRERHCYTEKLIDCLLTKTIPIYYGCSNVQDYFDTRGWIVIENESVDEILEKTKVLHPNYYSQYADVIEENYQRALKSVDNYKCLSDILVTIPGYKDS
jgi:hypothetical protein